MTSPRLQHMWACIGTRDLIFGTKSSGEIFQDTVNKEITCDIPGCSNIGDDILVFGKGQEEHDQCLEK